MPLLSVIVPLFDEIDSLAPCLASIRRSSFTDYELLVADDGAPDAATVAAIAERHHAKVVHLPNTSGPAVARNAAARAAVGDVLVFLDVDVTVHGDALERIAERFRSDLTLDALMGSYDLHPKVRGVVAAFRNLLHAHVHHRSSGEVTTFWAGCGGVRRGRFEELGGFAETYHQPSIEDVEFGMRLHEAGGRLVLDPAIQVTHHKEWTLASMLRTDTFLRALPWTEVAMRHGLPHNLNFRWRDRLSVMAAALVPPLAFLAIRYGAGWIGMLSAAIAALVLLQLPLFQLLARQRSLAFSLACLPLYVAHQLAAATGFVLGICRWEIARDRWLPWVTALLALAIFAGVQIAGGAYTAEFDAHPDESSHFMTGLMLRDLLVAWPIAHPVTWVEQYYLHYPKVALLHWPPLFHAAEAVWWLFLPPSRTTAMLLVGLIGTITAILFYRLAVRIVHPAAAAIAALILIGSPVFQQSASQTMADLPVLLFAVLTVSALAAGSTAQSALWCTLCLLVKGTGACLVPAMLLVFAHKRPARRLYLILPAAAALFLAATSTRLSSLAGLNFSLPWTIRYVWQLAGPGIAVLAAAGIFTLIRKHDSVTLAAAAVAISTVAVSFLLRAMDEPRHFILILPSLLLLALASIQAVPKLAAAALAIVVLAFFPWTRYQQHPAGYAQLAANIHQPARMLVSAASGWQEGSWVVLASLREPRPSSVIVRATKVLARTGWNPTPYRLIAATPADVENKLDILGIETVVLDDRLAGRAMLRHHAILRDALAANGVWHKDAVSGELSAWRRVRPPAVARQPLTIDLRRSAGRTVTER